MMDRFAVERMLDPRPVRSGPPPPPPRAARGRRLVWLLTWWLLLAIGLSSRSRPLTMTVGIGFPAAMAADFVISRRSRRRQYRYQSALVRQLLAQETSYQEPNLQGAAAAAAAARTDNLNHGRRKRAVIAGQPLLPRAGRVLDIGCSEGTISALYAERGLRVVGFDCQTRRLREFQRETGLPGICFGRPLPLRDGCADWINLTDVIEHLYRPAELLAELHRVLKPGGRMLITTDNRLQFKAEWINPFIALQYGLGLATDRVLPPRRLFDATWSFGFYHANYSRRELLGYFAEQGWRLVAEDTFVILQPLYSLVLRTGSAALLAAADRVDRGLARLFPFNRFGHHLLILEKS